MKQLVIIGIITGLLGTSSCNNDKVNNNPEPPKNLPDMTVTVDTLKQILEAFNKHDLNAIMKFFSEDCSLDMPRGPEPWGQRYTGKAQVREALGSRFKGIPNVHYGEDVHWLSADGRKGVSEWTLTGTSTSGIKINVRGCDLWELQEGKVVRKNSYWKIVER